ncbi:hypothetical protein HZY97_00650 [Sphingomonas sp. R-74633]|uniref:hypothetical protein n=1 Tax=Sphingomonas sp. R-74633 TaxID=2751188 RepID=UPI0015D26BF7|nr:hypothetical protein [Sphingomonas sp. R-74633]NYT39253.1 hypothetical protein [Sphingomonas sp. R-74633]
MTIESGNGQTVDQNRDIGLPFRVRLTNAAGQPDQNVGVTFTATRNNGLNAPELVATSTAGTATWVPGAFRNPGAYTITASAAGYNSVSFTVTVNDTPNDYDGNYYCTTYQGRDSTPGESPSIGSHEFTILNNALVARDPLLYHDFTGTYDPAAHTVVGYIGSGLYGVAFNRSPIVIDEEGTARLTGSFTIAQQDGGLQPRPRDWRCTRR